MLDGIPRISVLVITYNQENLIRRAIESLVAQKEYIYEICVSDDCSKDRTWEVLKEYSAKYPGLFVLNRNEPNVGIFENIEKTWTMPTGDLIYQLSGDDECGEGWFEKVTRFVSENNLDYEKEAFAIYSDFKCIYPNGDAFIKSNVAITSGVSPLRLSYRLIIGNRGTCYSKCVLKKFEKVSVGRSYIVESAQDRQLQMFSNSSYYIPSVGNIYYANIGVSGHMDKKDDTDRQAVEEYAMEFAVNHGFTINKKDYQYAKFSTQFNTFIGNKTIFNFVKLIILFLKSFDASIGRYNFCFKRTLFAFARRLPHSKPIEWKVI